MNEKTEETKLFRFKSVYARLLAMFITIIVFSMVVLGVLLGSIFRQQDYDKRILQMRDECLKINELIPNLNNKDKRPDAEKEIKIIARKYNALITIQDRRTDSSSSYDFWGDIPWSGKNMSTEMLDEIIKKQKQIAAPNMYKDIYGHPVLSVGVPMSEKGKDRIDGAILMHCRIEDIQQSINIIYQNVAISALVAIVLSVITMSVLTHRITRPLVQMGEIAKSYAKGDFSQRVYSSTSDEIGQLSSAMNLMAGDLENLESMRKSFVANVSHELKTPLASMRGFVQAVLDGSVPREDADESLEIVLSETVRLTDLINDLLDLSKIESGNFPLNFTDFDINELIARTLITFERRIEEKAIQISIAFEEERTIVTADADRITQVVRNFIDNAIKFTPKGGLISIQTNVDASRKCAVISVSDSGIGIPAEDLPFIWDRFYKVEKAHTPGSEGTGLGLSIVKRILDQHDSDSSLKSEFGKGTEFSFTLKLSSQS